MLFSKQIIISFCPAGIWLLYSPNTHFASVVPFFVSLQLRDKKLSKKGSTENKKNKWEMRRIDKKQKKIKEDGRKVFFGRI